MSCLKTLKLMFRGKRPSSAAVAATLMADESQAQATADHEQVMAGRAEAEALLDALRTHNASNRYDEWIRGRLSAS